MNVAGEARHVLEFGALADVVLDLRAAWPESPRARSGCASARRRDSGSRPPHVALSLQCGLPARHRARRGQRGERPARGDGRLVAVLGVEVACGEPGRRTAGVDADRRPGRPRETSQKLSPPRPFMCG